MPDEQMRLDLPRGFTLSVDRPTRTITGIAMPAGAVGTKDGRQYRFNIPGIKFEDRTPILMGHGGNGIGVLTSRSNDPDGMRVKMTIARTASGDEALELAEHGVLGMSIGAFLKTDSVKKNGDVYDVGESDAYELSLTPTPMYSGTKIETVTMSLSEGQSVMTEPTPVGTVPTPTTNPPPVAPVPPAAGGVWTPEQVQALVAAIVAQPTPVVPLGVPAPTGPTVVPVGEGVTRDEPQYRFNGTIRGKHSFIGDIVKSNQGDSEAEARLQAHIKEHFEGAVTTATAPTLNPLKTRGDLLVGIERYAKRPLAAAITTGGLTNADPFRWPILENEDPNLQDHVEGVEPSLGGTLQAGEASITPTGVSTKIKLSRESLMSDSTPSLDAWAWQSILYGLAQKYEQRIQIMLDGLTVTGTGSARTASIAGEDAVVVDALNGVVISNQFRENGAYDGLVLNEAAYTAFAGARDADGRPLVVFGPAVNADGSRSANFGNLYISGLVGVPAYALVNNSYLIRGSEVFQWTSTPLKFTLDQVEVANVYLGLLSLEAHHVMRNSAVIRLTR